jgi:hypothetical protein
MSSSAQVPIDLNGIDLTICGECRAPLPQPDWREKAAIGYRRYAAGTRSVKSAGQNNRFDSRDEAIMFEMRNLRLL